LFDLTTPFGWAGLAGTTFGAALLYAVSGFGFALLAVPLYLLIVDPALAVQFAIIVSTALAIAVVPGLRRTVAPALLLRLSVGNLAGLPIGLFSFRYADPLLVRLGGASYDPRVCTDHGGRSTARRAILAASPSVTEPRSLRWGRCRDRDRTDRMAGLPVLIYLLLAGTAAQTVRATLLAFLRCRTGQRSQPPPRQSAFLALPG